jgi:hypothetical protein
VWIETILLSMAIRAVAVAVIALVIAAGCQAVLTSAVLHGQPVSGATPLRTPVPSLAQQTALKHKFSIFIHYSICKCRTASEDAVLVRILRVGVVGSMHSHNLCF